MTQTSQVTRSRQIVLASRPKGVPTQSNFTMESVDVSPIEDGEFLVKNDWLMDRAGIDACINYKESKDLANDLAKHAPDGIDVYFDNVGGDHLEAALDVIGLFDGDNLGKQLVRIN